jgi:hypothetical protein
MGPEVDRVADMRIAMCLLYSARRISARFRYNCRHVQITGSNFCLSGTAGRLVRWCACRCRICTLATLEAIDCCLRIYSPRSSCKRVVCEFESGLGAGVLACGSWLVGRNYVLTLSPRRTFGTGWYARSTMDNCAPMFRGRYLQTLWFDSVVFWFSESCSSNTSKMSNRNWSAGG